MERRGCKLFRRRSRNDEQSGSCCRMFEALYNSRVNINMISTSEIRITVLVPEEDIDKAMNAVHDGFGLAEPEKKSGKKERQLFI